MIIPSHEAPTSPGEMLLEEFLIPMELSQRQLAEAIQVPYQRLNEIVNNRRGISASTALRLAKFFGNSVGFWLNVQACWDVYHVQEKEKGVLERIQPFKPQQGSKQQNGTVEALVI